jgi:hypothetical protein
MQRVIQWTRDKRRSIASPDGLLLRFEGAVIGAMPILALALAILEVIPLHVTGPGVVGPGVLAGFMLIALAPETGGQAVRGYLAGLIAVIIYDGTRMPFVVIGGWPDFIPKIGAWLLDESTVHWSIGYAWRYLGNGAGMGLTFAMIAPVADRWIDRRIASVVYGVVIWSGLVATLLAAPNGQERLFQLTPTTIAVSLTGHLVYGTVLGQLMHRWSPHPDSGGHPRPVR